MTQTRRFAFDYQPGTLHGLATLEPPGDFCVHVDGWLPVRCSCGQDAVAEFGGTIRFTSLLSGPDLNDTEAAIRGDNDALSRLLYRVCLEQGVRSLGECTHHKAPYDWANEDDPFALPAAQRHHWLHRLWGG